MRKFTLLVVAALLAATSTFARQQGRRQSEQQPRQQVTVSRQQLRQALERGDRAVQNDRAAVRRSSASAVQKATAALKAPRRVPADAISTAETPAGTVRDNLVAAFSSLYYNWWYGWTDGSSDASPVTLVEGADGNLYIQGLTPHLYDDEFYWIKAEPTAQQGRYVIHKQIAGLYAYYDEEDCIARLVYSEEAGNYVLADDPDIYVNYVDGVLTTDPAELDEDGLPLSVYGIVYEEDGETYTESSGGLYWDLTVSELSETYAELPAGVEPETLVLEHEDGAKEVQVAFVGNQVYIQSYTTVPGWYVGTIDGDKITFANAQFLGYDTYYDSFEWLTTAVIHEEYDEEYDEYYTAATIVDEVVFDYDADTKTITAPADVALYINGAKDRIYYAERYLAPRFFVFQEVPAVPADPVITDFWEYDEDYENAELDFTISPYDVDGNFITPRKLSYVLYVDDEVFEFEPDEYEDLEETIVEVPYGTSPDYYINSTWVAIFFQPAENIGLQTVYRGAGVTNRSSIVLYDVNTGDITATPFDNTTVGIRPVATQQVATEAYYDAAGRQVKAGAKGFVMKSVTLADGTRKTYKLVRHQ